MHAYEIVLATIAFMGFLLLLFKAAQMFWHRRLDRRVREVSPRDTPFELDASTSEVTASTPPSNDGAAIVVRPTPTTTSQQLTVREVRATAVRDRAESGLCLYCDRTACRSIPQVKLIKPLLDPLWRRLNVVPVNKWKIVTTPPVDVPFLVCESHQATARGHLEQRMAENNVAYAKFVVQQRDDMFELVEYGLDEIMLQDSDRIRRKRPEKPVALRAVGT